MVFIDPLAIMLFGVAASTLFIAYYVLATAMNKKNLAAIAAPMMVLGLFDFVSGFYMSFTWPLPGAYNMLFGDPMLLLGLIMLAGGFGLYKNIDVRSLSLVGFLLGIYLFTGSYSMVACKLERGVYLLPALSFFLVSALSAIVSPVVYLNPKGAGKIAYYTLAVLLVLVVILAMMISVTSLLGHLASPP